MLQVPVLIIRNQYYAEKQLCQTCGASIPNTISVTCSVACSDKLRVDGPANRSICSVSASTCLLSIHTSPIDVESSTVIDAPGGKERSSAAFNASSSLGMLVCYVGVHPYPAMDIICAASHAGASLLQGGLKFACWKLIPGTQFLREVWTPSLS